MGVNTLAFRLPQHGTFFSSDPDCAAHTDKTPWEFDHQYLDLVARSGAALFVSVDPRTIQPDQKAAFRAAMQTALSGGTPGGCEPLDWLHSTAPRVWRIGAETVNYRWEESSGAFPFKV
jgi:alpha-galactosidase